MASLDDTLGPARLRRGAAQARPLRSPGFSAVALLALLAGLLAPIKLSVVGDVYLAELVLPLVALFSMASGGARSALGSKTFRVILYAGLATLAGYILSDIVRGTRPDQFVRGWGRVLLVLLDFWCLAAITLREPRALWWFVLGMGLGRVAELRFVQHLPLPWWKFGYAEPMLLVAATLGTLLPRGAAAAWFAVLAYLSAKYDFRTYTLFCMALAGFALLRGPRPSETKQARRRQLTVVAVVAAAAGVAYLLLNLIGGDYWATRRETSNAGRAVGIEIGLIAVGRSPIIGYGSWPEDAELAQLQRKLLYDELGSYWMDPSQGGDLFTPHSQILQAWVEGGILGTSLFVALLVLTLRHLPYAAFGRSRDVASFLILYFVGSGLLNIFVSPFSAPHRIGIATGAACLVLLAEERRARARVTLVQPSSGKVAA
jgi:O-antigen ligase